MRTILVLASLAYAGLPAAAQHAAQHDHAAPEQLGRVQFETSCRPESAAAFNRAVALLHSFSFSAAKQAFEGVLAKDPSCAMAHCASR
jgi:lipoprotein NlpI